MRRGTSFIAGPPTASPNPGFVTTPTPSPRSNSRPGSSFQRTRAVRCAPSVTSGSSPASLTTTASARPSSSDSSHRSTPNATRRSSPLRGSLTLTCFCGSPLTSAFAAALAAAAAQVPVVQPVLSFSSFARAMLGGMAGSRSLRLVEGIGPVLLRGLRLGIRLAEHVREGGAVQMGAGALSCQARPHEDESLPRESRLSHAVGELIQWALDDLLVRPACPVHDSARGLGRVPALQKILLQKARFPRRQENGHRRAVGGEGPYVLAFRHRGAACAAREDHGLRHLRDGELAPDGRCRRPEGGDTGHDLPPEPQPLAHLYLFHDRTIQTRVPGVYPRHLQALLDGPLVERAHPLQRDVGGLDDLGGRPHVLKHPLVYQAPRPHHHVGLADEPRTPDRQQVRRPRPGPDKPYLAQKAPLPPSPATPPPPKMTVERYAPAPPAISDAGKTS